MEIQKLNINLIRQDENQPRKIFDKAQIEDLAKSIKKFGLLQPILVKKIDNYYQIVAGERRYRACKILNLEYVDVIVKDYENIAEIALIENIQRENLTPLEEAEAILSLKNAKNYTHEELSEILGKTRVYITNKLRILTADDTTKKMLKDNKISEGHARALLAEKDIEKRKKLAQKIISSGLSVRDVEKAVKSKKNKKNDAFDEDEQIIEMLEEKLSTKVDIKRQSEEKGSINIEFYSYEQLRDIIENIL